MYKKVYLEITNICNLNCSFCIKNQRTPKILSEEEFKIILKKLEGYTKYLYFHLLGEPSMHPKLNEFINVASKSYNVNITTNGYLIKRIENNKNIRQINISLHSFDCMYKKSLEDYMKDILEVIEKLKETTYVSLRLWAKNKNNKEILKYLETYYDKKIELYEGKKNITLDKNVFLSFEDEFTWPEVKETEEKNEQGMCYALRDHIGIFVDGTVVPCCLDSKGTINLGNIFEENLEDIIASERYQNMKKGFSESKRVEKLCQNCTFL